MNDIVKMAVEAGFEFYPDDGNLYAGEIACTTVLKRFARLVEQATLERAADVCRSWRGGKLLLNAGEMTGQELRTVRAVTEAAANEILRLKDSHD